MIIEDDATVAEVVARYLAEDGHTVSCFHDGAEGLQAAIDHGPDLVVLDLMLPTVDGFEVARRLRALRAVPIIMLTARGDETDRLIGLDLGADDYMAKPFSPRELVARVRAVLRRAQSSSWHHADPIFSSGPIGIDVRAHAATKNGDQLALTAREFELLAHLARSPGRAFRRDELLEAVWGYRYGDASTVTVHIRRLREKIEDDPSHPRLISTVWGVGYRWDGSEQVCDQRGGQR